MARSLVLVGVFVVGAWCASAPPAAAQVGAWRLSPRLCPDLREDRRDRLVVRGRRDLREDRRDARVVTCPVSAWVWTGPRYRAGGHPARPVATRITLRRGRYYYRPRRRAPFVAVTLVAPL